MKSMSLHVCVYSTTLVTRTPSLTRIKSHFPWNGPHFSHLYSATRLTRIPQQLELNLVFPITRILVLAAHFGCHPIGENTKTNTTTAIGFQSVREQII